MMANAVHPSIDFHPRPVSHSPSPFGFGFGLSNSAGWSSTATPNQMATFQHLASNLSQNRVQKRRHDPEEDTDKRDDAMDRSPTPERPKRAAPKRARTTTSAEVVSKDDKGAKENKTPSGGNENDIDVGVLLASLPPQSLLPLLTSLLNAQPSLKTTILPLIPRPTLETAIQALALSAKKLRDAYPYSNVSSSLSASSTTSFGFGSGFGSSRLNSFGGSTLGFGLSPQSNSQFGQPASTSHSSGNSGMRDSYILSRLRPHISEFVAASMSYLPYFSNMHASSHPSSSNSGSHPLPDSHSRVLQSLHQDKSHPSETYLFLSALTTHLLSQPALTQSSLVPLLLPRLSEEWKAWINRVDEIVNRQGGMFGSETVRSWEKGLDEFAETKSSEAAQAMRDVRDTWVAKVGWLVGRVVHHAMEEL